MKKQLFLITMLAMYGWSTNAQVAISAVTQSAGACAGTPANLSDGLFASAAMTTSTAGSWIKVDLGSVQSIGSVKVAGGSSSCNPFTVAGSLNGRSIESSTLTGGPWTSQATVSGVTDANGLNTFTFAAPVSAQFFRIFKTGAVAGTTGVNEFQLFAPVPMAFVSSTTTQANISDVGKVTNSQVIGIQIVTSGSTSPLNATDFLLNTTGTTNAAADITNAKLWYTGTSSVFATTTLFGTVAAPNGAFTISGTQVLSPATNYFWLTYDVVAGATIGLPITDYIDGECTSLTVEAVAHTPTATAPAGSRPIVPYTLTQSTTYSSCPLGTYTSLSDGNLTTGFGTNTFPTFITADLGSVPPIISAVNIAAGTPCVLGPTAASLNGSFIESSPNNSTWTTQVTISGMVDGNPPVAFSVGAVTAQYWRIRGATGVLGATEFTFTLSPPMTYVSSTTTQVNVAFVSQNTTNNEVIGIQIVTTGANSPISTTSFTLNTAGSTNAATDITNATLWYTGTSNTFGTTTQFGSVVAAPNGAFTITGTQVLSYGTNYFWLTYDVVSTATINNVIDATCTSLTVAGVPDVPTITTPAGARTIIAPSSPGWTWANQGISAGSDDDYGYAVSTDANGDVYITGGFKSSTISFGAYNLTNAGASGTQDIFVAKYNATGVAQWAYSYGGASDEWGTGIAVDGSGNVLVTGNFLTPTLSIGGFPLTYQGGGIMYSATSMGDIFVAKFNSSGSTTWAVGAGTSAGDDSRGISADAAGNSYVIGQFTFAPFIFGALTLNSATAYNIFIVKYNTAGIAQWAYSPQDNGTTFSASSTDDRGSAITVDASGNSYITGYWGVASAAGPFTATLVFGATTLTQASVVNNSYGDMYVAKIDNLGNTVWAVSFGSGTYNEQGNGIDVDGSGNIFVTGYFNGTLFNFGSSTLTNSGGPTTTDPFVVKLNNAGVVQWSKSGQGNGALNGDYGTAISVDANGYSSITGSFGSPTIVFGGITLSNTGAQNPFVVNYDPGGGVLCAAAGVGANTNLGYGVAVDASFNSYITGYFQGASATFGATTLTNAGAAGTADVFLNKFSCFAPLPIELLSFTGHNDGAKNILEWTTASETNNDYFTIERGKGQGTSEWEEIGKVQGAGNSSTAKNYSFTDGYPYNGINYYRLKQTDYDGNFTYSQIVSLTSYIQHLISNIYPNPANTVLSYKIFSVEEGTINVQVIDVLGNVVMKEETKAAKGMNTQKLNINALSQGMYFFKVTNGTEQTQIKFVKQ